MNGLPLHPMIVHLPLALAGLVPVLALVALGTLLLRRRARGLFVAVVGLQLLLALGAVAALRSGEAEEEKVEVAVSEAALHEHEEAAETFVAAAWIALGVSLVPAVWANRRGIAASGAVATLAATAVVLLLGVRVGEAGASLVYRHGAASVYAADAGAGGGRELGSGADVRSQDDDEDEGEDDD